MTPDAARPPGADLSRAELLRYGRHLILPEVGLDGQRRLKASSALVVGAGGLGSPLALYLAAAGVGRLGIVDFDRVDESNLQRQILHGSSRVGGSKVESARERLADLNPHVVVETHEARLTRDNAFPILSEYDVVVDGTDNFATRYLVNDACVLLGKPNVSGSIFRFEGQVSVFDVARGPCYRCLYPEPPPAGLVPSCGEGGVLGVLPGVIGTLQGVETLKLLLGIGEPLIGRLLIFDALSMSFRELELHKDPSCPLCGEHPSIRELVDYEVLCGIHPDTGKPTADEIDAHELEALRRTTPDLQIIDVREPQEWAIARIEGSRLIPLGTLPARASELDSSRPLVLLCHHGIRSARGLEFLRSVGFTRIQHLRGGIEAWSLEVDPQVPRY
jgi:adenylyltransferase/sulfurtransferase